jgi:hypothetical protein
MSRAIASVIRKQLKTGLALGAGWLCAATLSASAQGYIEAGIVYRGDMRISVDGGSRAAGSGVQAAQAGTTGSRAAPQASLLNDDGTAQVLRVFDNGYVGPSGWDWAQAEGWTQWLGYDTRDQYDSTADTLTYQLTRNNNSRQRRTLTQVESGPAGWTDHTRTDGLGPMVTLGYLFRQEKSRQWGPQLRIGWLDGIGETLRDRPAYQQTLVRTVYESTLRQQQVFNYSYDTLGNPAFPEAPYAMEDPAAPGPMISDTPTTIDLVAQSQQTSDRLVGRSAETVTSWVDLDIDAAALTLQAGPRLAWALADRLALLVQPALTVNMLDANVHRLETFRRADGTVMASWRDHTDEQPWNLGAGIEIGAQIALSKNWHLLLAGGYEWVEAYHLTAGPDRIRIDLSGYQAEAALGRSF